MSSKILLLFDIDKTLIDSSKVKDEIAFPEAIRRVYGVEASLDMIEPHGMTDQQIIVDLASIGVSEKEAEKELDKCMDEMISIYTENIRKEQVTPIKGAKEFLEKLKDENYRLGLVTGNLEPIGREKLNQADMESFFPVGGFGSDSKERSELVEIAKRNTERYYGQKFDKIVLVGDSPRDIKAGKKADVETVGVTMGVYSREELEEYDPSAIVEEWDSEGLQKIMSID
jgi:HAD superfamily hydrolase (TIGR01549 family)